MQRRNTYIFVLVDAASLFYSNDHLTMDGYHGGQRAAALLRQALVQRLSSLVNDGIVVPKFQHIIIYGFADVARWAAAADHGDLLRRVHCLERFIMGLDSDHHLTCFEDISRDAERSRSGFGGMFILYQSTLFHGSCIERVADRSRCYGQVVERPFVQAHLEMHRKGKEHIELPSRGLP